MGEQWIRLSTGERKRLDVLRQVSAGQLTVRQAAEVLELSERQMFRIVAAYRERRLASLAHGNRGRRPRARLPDELRARVVELARTKYAGYGQHKLQKALGEHEGIRVSRSTVRNILIEATMARQEVKHEAAPGRHASGASQRAHEQAPGRQAQGKHSAQQSTQYLTPP
jgi:transposase